MRFATPPVVMNVPAQDEERDREQCGRLQCAEEPLRQRYERLLREQQERQDAR